MKKPLFNIVIIINTSAINKNPPSKTPKFSIFPIYNKNPCSNTFH